MPDGKALGAIIGGFVAILIGASLIKPLADTAAGAVGGNNTGAGGVLTGLLALFFVIGVVLVAVGTMKYR